MRISISAFVAMSGLVVSSSLGATSTLAATITEAVTVTIGGYTGTGLEGYLPGSFGAVSPATTATVIHTQITSQPEVCRPKGCGRK